MEPKTQLVEYKDLTVAQAEQVAETLKATEDPHDWSYLTKDETVLARGQVQDAAQ